MLKLLEDRLKAELIGLYGMQGVYGMAHPRLTYSVNDYVDVRIGYIAIEGHSTSLFGQYKRNDEGYVRARWAEAETGRKRRYYALTAAGRKVLRGQKEQWQVVQMTLDKLWGLQHG